MAKPTPITANLPTQAEIPAGTRNAAAAYNGNVDAANTALQLLLQLLTTYSSLPVVRTVNGTEPDASGNFALATSVIPTAMTTAQRNQISGAALVTGLTIFNTTTNQLNVYGNSGWGPAGDSPSTAISYLRAGGVLTQVIETRQDGSKRVSTLYYTGNVLTKITRTNPTQTETFTLDGTGATAAYALA